MKEKEEINKSLNVLAKSAFVVLYGVLLSKIFTYIYRVIIARQFGPEVYGTFSLAINIVSLVIAVSLLGFDSGIVRFIPLYKSRKEEKNISYVINFSLKICFIASIVLGAVLFILSDFLSYNIFHEAKLSLYLKLFSFLIPVSVVAVYLLAVIIAYEKIKLYSFIENIATNGLNVLCLVLLLLLGFGELSVPLSFFIGSIILLLLTYILFKKYIPYKNFGSIDTKQKKSINKEFLAYSVPLLFFIILNVILAWVDSFSLGYFKGTRAVGFYNAAVPIAMLVNLAPQLFVKLFFPIITREFGKNNNVAISELSKQVNKWILFLNLPLIFLVLLFPERFIDLFFGKEYLVASNALRILVIGTFFISFSKVTDRILAMLGRSKTLLFNIVIAVIINFFLNALFIPMPRVFGIENSLGINGAAIATVISSGVLMCLSFFQSNRYISLIPLRRKMLNLLFAAVISLCLIWPFRSMITSSPTFIFASIVFGLVYLGLSLGLRALDANDKLIVKDLVKTGKKKD
ncbi:MAG: flippase [Candidatus Pacearchaeota archaeon]